MTDEYALSACTGKDRMSADNAKRVAQRLQRKGGKVSAYHCPCCGSWHVGRVY